MEKHVGSRPKRVASIDREFRFWNHRGLCDDSQQACEDIYALIEPLRRPSRALREMSGVENNILAIVAMVFRAASAFLQNNTCRGCYRHHPPPS